MKILTLFGRLINRILRLLFTLLLGATAGLIAGWHLHEEGTQRRKREADDVAEKIRTGEITHS
jgi:hypothetical protein